MALTPTKQAEYGPATKQKGAGLRHGGGDKAVRAEPESVRPVERLLLNLLLVNAEARDRLVPELKRLHAVERFTTRKIFEALFALHEAGETVAFSQLDTRLDENDRALLVSAVLADGTSDSSPRNIPMSISPRWE